PISLRLVLPQVAHIPGLQQAVHTGVDKTDAPQLFTRNRVRQRLDWPEFDFIVRLVGPGMIGFSGDKLAPFA
ncbi:MAG: hypothetical protein ACYC6L_10825, partial [Anaerolineae bacterium]